MLIDASAIVAILNGEAGHEEIVKRIGDKKTGRLASPLARFETVVALARSRSGPTRPTPNQFALAEQVVAVFCEAVGAEDIANVPAIGQRGLQAAHAYGKFVGREASLDFGDCFAYACASDYDARLLCKGYDFARTDLALSERNQLPPSEKTMPFPKTGVALPLTARTHRELARYGIPVERK